jgi:hypothetical protein
MTVGTTARADPTFIGSTGTRRKPGSDRLAVGERVGWRAYEPFRPRQWTEAAEAWRRWKNGIRLRVLAKAMEVTVEQTARVMWLPVGRSSAGGQVTIGVRPRHDLRAAA